MKLALHNYWRSSASHRVRIGLGLKELAYEYVVINILKREHQADTYRDRNPMAQVPTLEITEDDGAVHTIAQSLPILEYLEERFPEPPLFPRDPARRGGHVSLAHPDAWPICRALIERARVVPGFRGPDSIRLGLPPLYTRFTDVYDALERLRSLVERGEHKLVHASRLRVT